MAAHSHSQFQLTLLYPVQYLVPEFSKPVTKSKLSLPNVTIKESRSSQNSFALFLDFVKSTTKYSNSPEASKGHDHSSSPALPDTMLLLSSVRVQDTSLPDPVTLTRHPSLRSSHLASDSADPASKRYSFRASPVPQSYIVIETPDGHPLPPESDI